VKEVVSKLRFLSGLFRFLSGSSVTAAAVVPAAVVPAADAAARLQEAVHLVLSLIGSYCSELREETMGAPRVLTNEARRAEPSRAKPSRAAASGAADSLTHHSAPRLEVDSQRFPRFDDSKKLTGEFATFI